jgi:hypothetical protein
VIDARDAALLVLGWAAALRRSELVGLDWQKLGAGSGYVEILERGLVVTLPTSAHAAKRLTDQTLLGRIGVEDKDSYVRGHAVQSLSDQRLLARIATEDNSEWVRGLATERITDQGVLAVVSLGDKDHFVRRKAIARITNQGVLAQVAQADKHSGVRRDAVMKVTDARVLQKAAMSDPDQQVRYWAIKGINDPSILTYVAGTDASAVIRFHATRSLLAWSPAAESPSRKDGKAAKSTTALAPETPAPVLLVHIVEVLKANDQARLRQTAIDPEPSLRLAAIWKLTDASALEEVAAQSRSHPELMLFFSKVKDPARLRRIASAAADPAARIAAACLAGPADWRGALATSAPALGDAVVALSLFPTAPVPDASRFDFHRIVADAATELDSQREVPIQAMAILLEVYNLAPIADTYINSRHGGLRAAAQEWADRLGAVFIPVPGSIPLIPPK